MIHMMFFIVISVIFITLIFISIINTLLFISLKLITKERYKEHYLILPSLISLILWSAVYIIAIKVISSTTGTTIFDSISSSLFNTSNFTQYLPTIILPIVVLLFITLFLQSIVLLTVNVDYSIAFNKIRYFTKEKSKHFIKQTRSVETSDTICNVPKTDIKEVDEKYKLTFINAFVCSLFIFSLLFFLNILFFWIGTLIGNTMI